MFEDVILEQREKLIENARITLKKEFIGIDNEIDGLLNNIKPWFLFPELQQSPCVVNIFGLTGTGKTSIIKRIVQLLDIEEDLVYFNFASINEMQGWEIEENIEEQLSNESSKRVFVYDEFQYASTLDENGIEKDNKSGLKPFWELLDTGVIHKRNAYWTTREIQKVIYYLNKISSNKAIVIENGIWTNADECIEGFAPYDIRRFREMFNFKLNNNENEVDNNKKESLSLSNCMSPVTPIGFNYENEFFINEDYLNRIMELYDKVNEQNTDKLDIYHKFCSMSFDEIYDTLMDVLIKARKGYDLNFKQSIIFVIANLDEAYEMSFNVDPDMSADQFHKATKKISILDIKNALKKRFRNEQIARLGNIHMIYPSFNSDSFKKIIELYLNRKETAIEKQIFHQQSRSGGTSHLFPNFFHAAFDHITNTCQRFSRFRQHFHPSHRRNTGQSLTAKAQSQALQKVLHLSDLAGTMPQKSRADLLRLDTTAIIGNTNITNAAFFDLHGNLGGAGVHGVFQQLFDDAGRTLHHFTGGDQVGNMAG